MRHRSKKYLEFTSINLRSVATACALRQKIESRLFLQNIANEFEQPTAIDSIKYSEYKFDGFE
jgi:hypothetical protein